MGFVEPTKFKWVIDPASGRRVKKGTRDAKWKARYTDPSGRDRSAPSPASSTPRSSSSVSARRCRRASGSTRRANKSRFEDWVDVWWKTTVKLAPSTRRGYDKMLRVHLYPQFRGRRITSIDWVEVELFATSMLERGLSPKTVRETLSVLSLIMKTAMRARAIRENPAAGHSMPTHRQRTPVLTMEQVDRLVAAHRRPVQDRRSGCSSSPGCGRRSCAGFASWTSTGTRTRSRSTRCRCGSRVRSS